MKAKKKGIPEDTTIPPATLAELKLKNPRLCWRRVQGYEVLFRPMNAGEWEKFKAYNTDDEKSSLDKQIALENITADCLLYPSATAAEAMFEDMPGLKSVIGNSIVRRAGVTLEVEEGEL